MFQTNGVQGLRSLNNWLLGGVAQAAILAAGDPAAA
jgi:hypothetical protein